MVSVMDYSQATTMPAAADAEDVVSSVLSELVWFAAGFAVIQILAWLGILPQMNLMPTFPIQSKKESKDLQRKCAVKDLCAAGSAGQYDKVLEAWDREKTRGPLPLDALQDSTHALALLAPRRLVPDLVGHISTFPPAVAKPALLSGLVQTVKEVGKPALADELSAALKVKLGVGQEAAKDPRVQAYLPAAKDSLKKGDIRAALQSLAAIRDAGAELSTRAAVDMSKLAVRFGPIGIRHFFDGCEGIVTLPGDAIAVFLVDCLSREDLILARHIDRRMEAEGMEVSFHSYEALLKLYAKAGDTRAIQLFEDMQKHGFFASEGLCGNLLSRCGDAENIQLAECIMAYLRSRSGVTLAIFKTLMRVYARCGKLELACDLYDQVLAAGLEPDSVMYGCLIKFAVKCGRSQLADELFSRNNGGSIQNYMCLVRQAGKAGDVATAFKLLREVEERGTDAGSAMYNAVLDVCISNGRIALGQDLFTEMSEKGIANLVTYNTMLKGACSKGAVDQARAVFAHMRKAGLEPDNFSYNNLLDCMVSSSPCVWADVWQVLEEMNTHGAAFDRYTVSIMMKAAKRARCHRDAQSALAVLDRVSDVDVCGDDVVLSTVLDACMALKDFGRLRRILNCFSSTEMKPHMQTYGLLIKAFGMLGNITRCRALWTDMVERRGLTPSQLAFGCMLDALICAGALEDAVALLSEWKAKVAPSVVIYATLIKGFANANQPARAMHMADQLRKDGLPMNLVAYTSLIDAHARAGMLDDAKRLLSQMESDGITPNVVTFCAFIKGLCMQGSLKEAFETLGTMLSRGLLPDAVLFNTLLDGCVKHSDFELADRLLADVQKYGVHLTPVTVAIVVKMWGRRRNLDNAFATVRNGIAGQHCDLDARVGNALVMACLQNQAPERALGVLEEMRSWHGCAGPDKSIFSLLVSGLVRAGMHLEAVEVAKQACAAAHRLRQAASQRQRAPEDVSDEAPLSEEALRSLLRALKQRGATDVFEGLVQKVKAVGIEIPACDQGRAVVGRTSCAPWHPHRGAARSR